MTKYEALILSTETKLLDSDCVSLVITSVNLEYCKISRGPQLNLSTTLGPTVCGKGCGKVLEVFPYFNTQLAVAVHLTITFDR